MTDCVVIGAGLAGLTAATKLVAMGHDVVVLEARDRVGGRIENATLSEGEVVELGGQWIAPSHRRMFDLVKDFELQLIEPQDGDVSVKLGGSVAQVPNRDELEASLNPFEVADLGEGLARFRRLADRVTKQPTWAQANHAWLERPLTRWISSNLRTPAATEWFTKVFHTAFGVDAEQVTLIEGLQRANQGADMEAMIAVNGGVTQRRVDGGAAVICERMAAALGDRVLLGVPVTGISEDAAGVTVTTADGTTHTATTVINTMPPKLAVALPHTPALEPWRQESADKVPAGQVIKAFLVYPEPWWRGKGRSGQMGADSGAVRVSFDTSPDGGRGVLMGFFEGSEAEGYAHRSQTLRQRAFADAVAVAFDDPEREHEAVEYLDRDWSAEEFTKGCHGAHFAPGVWTAAGPALAVPHGAVLFAGAEYSAKHNGYMEGAVRSGELAAAEAAKLIEG